VDKIDNTALYLVPTPIGNLGDITFRAIEILKSVDVILAEDTRKTSILLKHYSISGKLQSFHLHNEHKITGSVVSQLKQGLVMALVSDAGTPGISDPGFLLVRACLAEGLRVNALPGPTAFVPALINSGLPCDRFLFEGFLPHKKGRTKRLHTLKEEDQTMVFYESPHRLLKMIGQLIEIFGADRLASVSRELTKIHEETINGTLMEIHEVFVQRKDIKGEIVIIVNGKK
jgi:16S rRNA (cytidine1402-2'-O)-methyltransferase